MSNVTHLLVRVQGDRVQVQKLRVRLALRNSFAIDFVPLPVGLPSASICMHVFSRAALLHFLAIIASHTDVNDHSNGDKTIKWQCTAAKATGYCPNRILSPLCKAYAGLGYTGLDKGQRGQTKRLSPEQQHRDGEGSYPLPVVNPGMLSVETYLDWFWGRLKRVWASLSSLSQTFLTL